MSKHCYSRCWIHLIWGTLDREKLLNKATAGRISRYITDYTKKQSIYMKTNYVNADHVHALVDLPTAVSIEKVIQLLKRNSSHWINSNDLVMGNPRGAEGMAHFQYQSQTWLAWRDTSRIKRNIIACIHSRRN